MINLTCSFNAPLCEKCNSPCIPTSSKYRCTSEECGFEYQKCNKKRDSYGSSSCNGVMVPRVPMKVEPDSKIFLGCSFYSFGYCDNVIDFDANCPKCGNGKLVRRNKGGYKTQGEPFIGCSKFFSEQKCDYKNVFKNGIYKNSNYLIDSYW